MIANLANYTEMINIYESTRTRKYHQNEFELRYCSVNRITFHFLKIYCSNTFDFKHSHEEPTSVNLL